MVHQEQQETPSPTPSGQDNQPVVVELASADIPVETASSEVSTEEGNTKLPLSQLLPLMVKEAFSPRKLLLLVLFLAAAAVCARLGVWQLDRAYERANLAKQHEIAEAEAQKPTDLGDVLAPQEPFAGSLVGKYVAVTGVFAPEKQFLVTGRSVGGQDGFLVLNSFVVSDDGTAGQSWKDLSGNPQLPVVRGWVPRAAVGTDGQLTSEWAAKVSPADGETELLGWLQASEASVTVTLPAGQTMAVSSAALANAWGGPIYGGYLVVKESSPQDTDAIVKLPRPSIEGGDGLNLQNVFYALQWWVFGLFALALWLRLVRDDAIRSRDTKPVNPFDILDAQD